VSDSRIEQGMRAELALRRRMLDGGADPIGWKVAFNIPAVQELLGIDRPLAGFMTTDGLAQDGVTWPTHGEPLVAEPEVAAEIAADGRSIAALLPALEVSDPPDLALSLDAMLAGNLFHRAVVFGPRVEADAPGPARVLVNGDLRAEVDSEGTSAHLAPMVEVIAGRLSDAGERLRPGDRIITGVIAPPAPVEDGDTVRLELECLGAVELTFGALQ
jgi:2-keto-4-pentenoate hydratase